MKIQILCRKDSVSPRAFAPLDWKESTPYSDLHNLNGEIVFSVTDDNSKFSKKSQNLNSKTSYREEIQQVERG